VATPPRQLAAPIAPSPTTPALAPTPSEESADSVAGSVILVVLDGVRWQEVFEGVDPMLARRQGLPREEVVDARALMPTLHEVLIGRGVAVGAPGHGLDMRATGPNYVSLPGYTEILTGRTASSCHDNLCPAASRPTLADEVASAGSVAGDAVVIASWESLERAASSGADGVVISAGRHGGSRLHRLRADPVERDLADEASRASPFPGEADFRPDHYTADLALLELERHAPRFLFLGLGEPDEYAHRDDYRGYLRSLRAADAVLARLVAALDRMGDRGRRTAIFVTTDHGRSRSFRDHGGFAPESGRVWLVASGGRIAPRGLLDSNIPHRLADIAPTMRELLALPPDGDEEAGRTIREALAAR
jgi:hypothetical protein